MMIHVRHCFIWDCDKVATHGFVGKQHLKRHRKEPEFRNSYCEQHANKMKTYFINSDMIEINQRVNKDGN